jgi:hypothetical protein
MQPLECMSQGNIRNSFFLSLEGTYLFTITILAEVSKVSVHLVQCSYKELVNAPFFGWGL